MDENTENLNFRTKPRDRKSPIGEEIDRLTRKEKLPSIPQESAKSPGRKIQVWFNDEDLKVLQKVMDFHQYSNQSIAIKESVKRDWMNVMVVQEKIAELKAEMKKYNIRPRQLE